VLELNLEAVGGLVPDRTFLLELDPGKVHARLSGEHDRLEREDAGFHARAAEGYREIAARFPERIVVLDGARSASDLAEEVYGALRVRS
jgi:dTMP kinase